MPLQATRLNHDVILTRWFIDSANEVGTVALWQQPLDELYAQMPFPGLWAALRLDIFNMTSPEQDARRVRKQSCLEDYDPNRPGNQQAAGLCYGAQIDLGVYPPGYTPDGPPLPTTPEAVAAAKGALSHEVGHFYFNQCRVFSGTDDIAHLLLAHFRRLRPHQAANDSEVEDGAESFKAVCGDDAARGTFSDGKPFVPAPEFRSLIRCMFWLSGVLKGKPVDTLTPGPRGVMYRTLISNGWVWRWVSADDWHSEHWTGSAWVRI